ncbi:MAG: TolC family protein [Planctomycetota bacterium]|jgi:outer membrane protein TolC
MSFSFRVKTLLFWTACAAVIFGLCGGCSREHYKSEADEEVYKIIDSKWRDDFGHKANYIVSDASPLATDLQIEKAVPTEPITLAQAVAMATAHNRDYQSQKENLYLIALDLTLTRHKYARQWFGIIDGGYAKGLDSRGDVSEDTSVEGGFGFDQTQLLADGLIISSSLALNWVRFLAGDPRTSLGSVLSATAALPLLGAGGGKVELEQLTQAEREVLYRIRSFNRYRKTFVVSIINNYYRVLQQRDRVTNEKNNYNRVVESRERIEMEAEAGRRTRLDVDEAQQNVLRAEDTYVAAVQRYEQLLDEFKITLSLPTDANITLDQNELTALEEIGMEEFDYTVDAAVETALLRRLDLVNSMDRIDDSARKIALAGDGLGTQLNLIGSTGVSSGAGTDFARLEFGRGDYELGFEADLPLDRKAERNAYREALIALQQRQREYDNSVDRVKLDVRQAYRQLQEAKDTYKIRKNSLDLASKRVETNKLLLDAGRVEVRYVLESQDDLVQAQNNVTAALVDYTIAKLSFFRDTGILQVRPDGMWE